MRVRSRLDPEERPYLVVEPTRYRIGKNQSPLACGFCGETYYVDQVTFDQALSQMEEGIDNPFCCEDCLMDYEDISH